MIAQTRVETIGRCLPPESGKFCTLFYNADLLHYEIRTPDGVTAFCKGDYTGAITEGWNVEQANLAFYSDITITAPNGERLSFSDIMLA